MNRRTNWKTIALGLALCGLGACSFFSPQRDDGPAHVNDLVGSVERVYVDAELSREKARVAIQALQSIAATDFRQGDAVGAYASLVAAIDDSEEQAGRLASRIDSMQEAAGPVFERWAAELETMNSASLRERSQARLEMTRSRYDAILAAAEPARATFDAFNQGIRDHAIFLSHDFNPGALAAIQDDVRNLAGLATELDKRFDECLLSTRAYVQSAALPVAGKAPPAEPQEERIAAVGGSRSAP